MWGKRAYKLKLCRGHRQKDEEKESEVKGWSTEKMEEKANRSSEARKTGGVTHQEGTDNVWKSCRENCGRSAGEVESGGEQEESIQRMR